jgi:hypothetical protein
MNTVSSSTVSTLNYLEQGQSEVEKDYNEEFINEYNYGDRPKAIRYLEKDLVDPNYGEGAFLSQAARENDVGLIAKLFEKGATAGLAKALEWAALKGHTSCMELLIKHGADPDALKGKLAYTNNSSTRQFLAERKLEKEESVANILVKSPDISSTITSSTSANSNNTLINERLFKSQTSYAVSSSGEVHKAAHGLTITKSKSGTFTRYPSGIFTRYPIKPIGYQAETLAKFSETITAEIHKLTEKSDLSSEECKKIQDLSRTLVELKHVKNDYFILKEIHQADVDGGKVQHFVINLEAISEVAMYSLPLDKLHYVEKKVFELAISELTRQFSAENPINEEFAPNAVVVTCFARQNGTVKISSTTNLPELHSIVLWKNKDEIVLIDPTTSKFGQHISEFLNLRFKSFKFVSSVLGVKYPSHERKRPKSIANYIALKINQQKDLDISTFDGLASIMPHLLPHRDKNRAFKSGPISKQVDKQFS